MAAQFGDRHDDRHPISCGKSSRIEAEALDPAGIFFDVWGIFGRGGTARIDDRCAGQHDHVAAFAIAVEIKRDAGIAIDIANLLVVLTVDVNFVSTVPEKPDQTWLWDAVRAHRCQPTNN